ncbi:MAG: secondary thiamine-phosphate synthase enzyme YjbQ [Candidatus Nanopelagicales bacterium]
MESTLIEVHSGSHVTTDITDQVQRFCEGRGDGLCSVFVPHATAGVALFETGSGTEEDVESFLEDVLPRDERYRHRHGSPGHGRDHVLPAVISPSLTIPVLQGRLQLGTWQSVVLVDTNGDNPRRQVRVSFLHG